MPYALHVRMTSPSDSLRADSKTIVGSEYKARISIQAVQGTNANDTITGSDRLYFEQFEGLGGNDTIDGGTIDFASGFNANRVTYQSVATGSGGVSICGIFTFGAAPGCATSPVPGSKYRTG